MEIWEPKPLGTLWDTPGLLWDCFTFYVALVGPRVCPGMLVTSHQSMPHNFPSKASVTLWWKPGMSNFDFSLLVNYAMFEVKCSHLQCASSVLFVVNVPSVLI